jgi:hypothetical protein
MSFKLFLGAGAVAATLLAGGSAFAFPAFGADPSAGTVITYGPGGAVSTQHFFGPYDGIEDSYVGVVNNSGSPISLITVSSNLCITCFDGDGIDTYGAPSNSSDTTGYGGPNAFFSNMHFTGGLYYVDVNFITPIAHGGTDYFSLEEDVSLSKGGTFGVPEPATWALMLMGFGGMGAMLRRGRRETAIA